MTLPVVNEFGFRYFTPDEFKCKHTGMNEIDYKFIEALDRLRYKCEFPFVITSGYRHETHPVEAKKDKPGTHNQGIAADIKVNNGWERYMIIKHATAMGFRGIGVEDRFVHVDLRDTEACWTY